MHVSSTEIQNNFGKYLMLSNSEPIIITKNGKSVAQLTSLINTKEEKEPIISESSLNELYSGSKTTFDKFLELTGETGTEDRYEYIDGKIYYLASPKTTHQKTQSRLLANFFEYFLNNDCIVMVAPYDITLKREQNDINVVQPDIMVICDLEENLNEKDYYLGAPTLLVEILSDSTRSKDMIKKLDLYINCGVEEYWIINTFNQEVIVYQGQNNELINASTYKKTDDVKSFRFKEFQFSLENIFK